MFLIVAVTLLCLFSWTNISSSLAATPPDKSLLHPFQIGKVEDFNIWFVLIWMFGAVYSFMAWQGNQGFNCSAASPHEAKMGRILGTWRGFAMNVMMVMLPICAYTFFNHPDYAQKAAGVTKVLNSIENTQIQEQMRVPLAMSYVLPVGVKGVLCAIMFFLMITTDVSYLHSWGSIVIQDVVLPFRKKPFTPRQHLWLLRLSITAVAIFGFFFSLLFRQVDYIMMFFAITGAIFLGGAGSVIVGGLYWKKGTTAAAWSAMIVGSTLAVAGIVIQQIIPKFPVNGTVMWFISMMAAIATYIVVSLLTCKKPFNMAQMLHRGKYARTDKPGETESVEKPPRTWKALLGIDENFTRGDKILSIALFAWSIFWFIVFVVITVLNLIKQWPVSWWSSYWYYTAIVMPIVLGVVTSVWYTVGGIVDLRKLFHGLRTVKRNTHDDGMVVDHRNVDEITPDSPDITQKSA
jgi:SSS family solute:Na+ symporter